MSTTRPIADTETLTLWSIQDAVEQNHLTREQRDVLSALVAAVGGFNDADASRIGESACWRYARSVYDELTRA